MENDIRDLIFPIVELNISPDGNTTIRNLLGTGFIIREKGIALSASHVTEDIIELYGLFVENNKWVAYPIKIIAKNTKEDICLIKINKPFPNVFLKLSNDWEGASCPYMLWGYPEDTATEIIIEHNIALRPDLIYSEGHIRRRISNNNFLPIIKSKNIFELSAIAGQGCSGGPVIHKSKRLSNRDWLVIGVYIGEKINERQTSVSYAVRLDAIFDWVNSTTKNLPEII